MAADLLLSSLNTDDRVSRLSAALIVVERQTSKALASLFDVKSTLGLGIVAELRDPDGHVAKVNKIYPPTSFE